MWGELALENQIYSLDLENQIYFLKANREQIVFFLDFMARWSYSSSPS